MSDAPPTAEELPADGSAVHAEGDQGGTPEPTPGMGAEVEDEADEIAKRTGPNAAHDSRFRHSFVLPPPDRGAPDDWADADGVDDIHEANKVAFLEQALHRGLHPRGDVEFEGERSRPDGSVELTYSVPVVPTPADASATETPMRAREDMGGKTINAEGTPDTAPGFEDGTPEDSGGA